MAQNELLYQEVLIVRKALERYATHLFCLQQEKYSADREVEIKDAAQLGDQFKDAARIVIHSA